MDKSSKYESLLSSIRKMNRVAVAYSGGVDSTFLLKAAKEALGDSGSLLAVTAEINSMPEKDRDATSDFCKKEGIELITVKVNELDIPGFVDNPPDRCYICKNVLFGRMLEEVKKLGDHTLMDGSNIDDDGDYRPGMKALKELGVVSPLKEAGLTKQEIRELSKELGLPTWDTPSAACLSSRIPYGEKITVEKLRMIDSAEEYIKSFGIRQVRVRMHGDNLARIEVASEDFSVLIDNRESVHSKLKDIGFAYVTMDMIGYRTGSMNEVLKHADKGDS
ncbi:uncharacterized protein SAMN02910369_02431 [Lachnospiraceae bacterium NE2001]|nr:uncharacterized protein SAMN02910369_02431 [Lachnospiraceae bacterium NE2001]